MSRDFLDTDELKHYGTEGMRWYVRRYQNKDGSLTPEGRLHWGIGDGVKAVKNYAEKQKIARLRKKKEAILRRGDLDEIMKNRELFTERELARAHGRVAVLNALREQDPAAVEKREQQMHEQEMYRLRTERGHAIVQDICNGIGSAASMMTTMAQGYTVLKAIKSAMGGHITSSPGTPPTPTPTPSPTPPTPSNPPTPTHSAPSYANPPSTSYHHPHIPVNTFNPPNLPSSSTITNASHLSTSTTTSSGPLTLTGGTAGWTNPSHVESFISLLDDVGSIPASNITTTNSIFSTINGTPELLVE